MKARFSGLSWGVAFFVLAGVPLGVHSKSLDEGAPSTTSLLSMMEDAQDESVSDSTHDHGEHLFQLSCTQCHDAERSMSKVKSLEAWEATVRRMADKSGANIPESQIEPIAEYLVSLSTASPQDEREQDLLSGVKNTASALSVSLNGAVSLLWRDSNEIQENNGFFPDMWVGAEWHPKDSPFSVRVMACTSCHENAGGGMTFELAEASFTADLFHLVSGQRAAERNRKVKADVKAGRFIVPFGAFSDMVHPGSYRTMTAPLMFNMGRRVGPEEFAAPVLPMPYSDEGLDLHLATWLPAGLLASLDLYAVNGLQSDLYASRSYRDNNTDTALGGRATLGNAWFRIGGSYGSGEMQFSGAPSHTYDLVGGDMTIRYLDWFRAYYEYARREEEMPSADGRVNGHVVEVEGQLWQRPRITLLIRYDSIDRSGFLGDAFSERYTWGPVITLPGGSLLIVNHEHWVFDMPPDDEDVVGFRWVVVF